VAMTVSKPGWSHRCQNRFVAGLPREFARARCLGQFPRWNIFNA
jgi:hypothetical protein